MRQRSLYASMRCIVHPTGLDAMEIVALESCLRDGGATLLKDINAVGDSAMTHIVCHAKAYQTFVEQRNERFVALVRPEWVFRTFLLQCLLPVDRFSPNPALIFSTLAISAGAIGKDPRKVINGLITHFGGQIVDQKEVYGGATHILYQDEKDKDFWTSEIGKKQQEDQKLLQLQLSKAELDQSVEAWCQHLSATPSTDSMYLLPTCVVAFIGQRAGLATQHHVKYTWIEECVMRQSRVLEGQFYLKSTRAVITKPNKKKQPNVQLEDLNLSKCAHVYQLGKTALGTELSLVRKLPNDKLKAMKKTLQGAIVLLAQHIAPLLREKLSDLLKSVDAKVANVPFGNSFQDIVSKVVMNASFVVCRYRGGFEYNEAMRQGKTVVSIYWVFAGLLQVSKPTSYNEAIQRPVRSFGSIPGMQSFVITLSGYSSRSSPTREELQIAIHATGACLLPVLSRMHSTHLLCYESSGEKYKKALSWRFDNVLNHEWVFACLSKWEHVAEETFRYNSIKEQPEDTDSLKNKNSGDTNLDEKLVSKTKLATKLSTRSVRKTKKAGQGRFDVEDILTEIDNVPALSDKKLLAYETYEKATTPAAITNSSNLTPGRSKDVACTLFDTPTNTSASPTNKRESRKNEPDEAVADVEEVEKEPAVTATKPECDALKVLPSVMDISSDSNVETATETKVAAKKSKTKKRKGADSVELDTSKLSKSSSKKQKKETAVISSSKTKRVFLLSGDRDQATVHTSIISSLGANVSKFGRVFDSNCTHIICSELKRTEKFIAGCAAGKWILKPSYLDASAAAENFVDEAAHEWGSHKSDDKDIDSRIWPEVCKYWRKERAGGHPGAFAGWCFFIHAKCTPPREMCERIILAGGGIVIPLTKSADFDNLAKESTPGMPVVALFSPEVPPRDLWLKKLKTHNIECLKANFLIDYVTKKQTPRVKRAGYHL
ncbi:unnamed protein product [Peronospora destructor]|uniref:BRCT domain-containing protein n=1 Tax=Peronospora destructor TaxID=86335 RepID=A0AAV0TW98_9STRA|nr:unnamed protein product [Peronospora destructor]